MPSTAHVALDPVQAATLGAIFADMWPSSAHGPDATALGAVTYTDRALGGHDAAMLGTYRAGLARLDDTAAARCGRAFASAAPAERHALLDDLANARLAAWPAGEQRAFFQVLRRHLTEGLFADPAYGGNAEAGGWRSIGFPGVVLSHAPEDHLAQATPTARGALPTMQDALSSSEPDLGYRDRAREASPAAEADVVIVGAGGVGALVASWLALGGLRVVALEAGDWRSVSSGRPDELRNAYYARAGFGEKFNREVPTWRDGEGADTQPMPFSLGRMCNGVGGSLIHYGARLRRQHPHQFRMRSTLADLGLLGGLDPDCTVADWPFGYDELEPHYEALEQLVGIAGADTHPFIPRRRGLPMPPARAFASGQKFMPAARARGLHPEPVPVGQNTVPYAGRPAMDYSPWGEGMGSPTRARWMPDDDLLPQAIESGNLKIRVGCRVLKVLTDATGRACGVSYVDETGRSARLNARTVILSAYTFENIRLMYLSGDDRRPDGLGNNHGQLGRHFMTKQFPSVYGSYPGERFNRHTGPGAQGLVVEDMLTPAFMAREGLAGGGTLSTENQLLPIQIGREPLPAGLRAWGAEWKQHVCDWNERLAIRIQTDTLPYRANRLDLDPMRRDASGLGVPVVRATYSIMEHERRLYGRMIEEATALHRDMGAARIWPGPVFTGIGSCHDLGGCRMGEDPRTSVVGPDLEVHDTPGLYVMGGAVFPSCHAVNPTLTIWAVCKRATERLLENMR